MATKLDPGDVTIVRTLTLFGAASTIIGCMIGSGIFANGYFIFATLQSSGVSLIVWVLGAMAAICGGLTWAEWALMIPASGGDIPYLERAFPWPPKIVPFVYVWCRVLFINPLNTAALSIISSEFFLTAVNWLQVNPNEYAVKGCSLVVLVMIVLCIAFSNAVVNRSQVFLSALKQLLLLLLILMGIAKAAMLKPDEKTVFNPIFPSQFDFKTFVEPFLLALFCFDGFANLSTVIGELKYPRRDTLRAILLGTISVSTLYIIVNICYFVPFNLTDFLKESQSTFAVSYVGRSVGLAKEETIRVIFTLLFFVSAFGSGISNSFAGSRVAQQSSISGFMPFERYIGSVNRRFGTPLIAILMQAGISAMFILGLPAGKGFKMSCVMAMYTAWILYAAGSIGLIIFRFKEPNRDRPFKVFLGCPIYVAAIGILIQPMGFFLVDEKIPVYNLVPVFAWAVIAVGVIYYFVFLFRKFRNES